MKTRCLNRIIVAALVAVCIIPQAYAEEYVRIGTGGTAGTYFPIGRLIADIISQPGTILATAQPSNGSLGNVIAVSNGALETGLSQADIAAWAKNGTGIFEGRPRLPDLRLIANLYPESMHIVVRKDSGITRIEQLKGKRVALDEPGSGTLISARQILAAHGLKEADIRPEYIKTNRASDRLIDGSLDAFFFTGGTPGKAVADLAASGIAISLLPIEGQAAERLMADSRFLHADLIPVETYKGVAATRTLAVGAQWVTSDRINAELIYQITKTLYGEAGQRALANGHPKGSFINLANAVKGAAIPFHPGAERYFREVGILK